MQSVVLTRSLTQLNQQRRQAVRMRRAGSTLAEIQRATGLSAPTIIAAYKAFQLGGWPAVDTAKRGRPMHGSPRLSADAEAAMLAAICQALPQASGLPGYPVWTQAAMAAWVKHHHHCEMPARNTARLIHRWGLHAPAVVDQVRTSRSPVIQQWRELDYRRYQEQARREKAQILWIGERSLAHGSLYQLFAHTPRGELLFLVTELAATIENWRSFLLGLQKAFPKKIFGVFSNPHLANSNALGPWLASQRHQMESIYLPMASPTPTTPLMQITTTNSTMRPTMPLTHLQRLEAESIHIMREVVAEAENPVMLYSIGKDSAVMLHLAMKAFFPAIPPFPLLHVDTRWKFRDMYAFRDKMAKELGMKLLVHVNPEGVKKDINPFTHGSAIHTDIMKTEGLKQALDHYKFDAAFGGARRDEEKSRAKERIFSFRTAQHRWDPKNQRPELWKLYNARKHKGESMRVFPLSNWTELDIWQYIYLENIPIVPLYYSALRPVVQRDGALIMVDDDRMPLEPGEVPMMKKVRFRTLGCYPLTGAVESEADTLPAIIQEMLLTRTSERQGRVIDHDSAASMEKKKQEGYF